MVQECKILTKNDWSFVVELPNHKHIQFPISELEKIENDGKTVFVDIDYKNLALSKIIEYECPSWRGEIEKENEED